MSRWNTGCRRWGRNWYSRTSGKGIWGHRLGCRRMGYQGLDGLWDAVRMTCVPEDLWILSKVLATIGAGENAYTNPKLSQEIDKTSTPHAVSSEKGGTKMGVTLLAAVANMFTRGFHTTQNRLFKVSCGSRHSVGLGLFITQTQEYFPWRTQHETSQIQSNPVISCAVNSRKSVSRACTLDPKF